MVFPCSQCGACCRKVGNSHLTRLLDRGDGVCRHLDTKTELCLIYEDRPSICRVDESYLMFSQQMSLEQYYAANIAVCNTLQSGRTVSPLNRISMKRV